MHAANLILAIEVSNPGAGPAGPGVCLARFDADSITVLASSVVRISARGGHDDDLMPAIDRTFTAAGLSPRTCDLTRIAVSAGPGGYTSVRVACAVGKMIAEATGASCVSIGSASVALRSAPAQAQEGRVCVLLASKGDTAWGQIFSDGVALDEGVVLDPHRLATAIDAGIQVIIADHHLPIAMREIAQSRGIRVEPAIFSAEACAQLGIEGAPIDPLDLTPIYPREPDAVTLWRNRKPNATPRQG